MTTVFSGTNERETRLSAVDDPTNLDQAMSDARERYPEATVTSEVEVGEIVFTDATTAAFFFRLRYTGAPLLPTRVGTAHLVGEQWLVTRQTLCEVLSAAGATCPPTAAAQTS